MESILRYPGILRPISLGTFVIEPNVPDPDPDGVTDELIPSDVLTVVSELVEGEINALVNFDVVLRLLLVPISCFLAPSVDVAIASVDFEMFVEVSLFDRYSLRLPLQKPMYITATQMKNERNIASETIKTKGLSPNPCV